MLKNASWGYVLRAWSRVAYELALSIVKEGPKALPHYGAAVYDGLSQRRAVSRLAREDRRAIERRWIADSVRREAAA
jgi:hypothetical protein